MEVALRYKLLTLLTLRTLETLLTLLTLLTWFTQLTWLHGIIGLLSKKSGWSGWCPLIAFRIDFLAFRIDFTQNIYIRYFFLAFFHGTRPDIKASLMSDKMDQRLPSLCPSTNWSLNFMWSDQQHVINRLCLEYIFFVFVFVFGVLQCICVWD